MRLAVGAALVALATLGTAADPAWAQDPRLAERLDAKTATRVEQVVDSARRMGLPTEPLVQKALEGHSKGAPSARIVTAVESVFEALGQARSSLGSSTSPEEIAAGAMWLRAGGQPADLGLLRRSAPNRPLAVPLAVSTELLSRGYARAGAVESVSTLLVAGLSDPEFLALKNRVDDAVRGGSRYDAAVRNEVAKIQAARKHP